MKVFFSHSSSNKSLIREVASQLTHPLDAWVDEREMVAGQFLREALQGAIASRASYFVIFLDTYAIKSPWVQAELQWARQREEHLGRPFVVPVILDTEAKSRATELLGDRIFLECTRRDEYEVRLLAERLSSQLFSLIAKQLENVEGIGAAITAAGSDSHALPVRTWRKRSELSPEEWKQIFAQARGRIWLLGHAMRPAFHPKYSGNVLRERIAAGIDVRLVVLDPDDSANMQISEVTTEMQALDLRMKIKDTLDFARILAAPGPGGAPSYPNVSIGVTRSTIHNSIVIVDDRVIVTLYSHNREMGDTGVTLDLQVSEEAEPCAFFEREYLWHWAHARPAFDPLHSSPDATMRILNHAAMAQKSVQWFKSVAFNQTLPPPHLAVVFPTFRCHHEARARIASEPTVVPAGPHSERLLCSNCMFGSLLNRRPLDMSVLDFDKLCKQLIDFGVKLIEITGGGEPLHHPAAEELIETIARYRSGVDGKLTSTQFGLISNAAALLGLDRPPPSVSLLASAFSYIRWSWPEDAELDRLLRSRLLAALKRFVSDCDDLPLKPEYQPRVGVKVLVTATNVNERGIAVLKLVEDLVRSGVAHVKIRTLRSARNASDEQLKHVADGLARLESALWQEGLLGGSKTLEVDLAKRYVPADYKCNLSTLMTVIEPNGDVRMCWNDVEQRTARIIGNVFAAPFSDIWGSGQHHRVCRDMQANAVCNSTNGCHCRIVGYQEVVSHLLPAYSVPLDDAVHRTPQDTFL